MRRPIYPSERAGFAGRVRLWPPQLTALIMSGRPEGFVCGIKARPAARLAELGLVAVAELMRGDAVRLVATKRGEQFIEGYRRLRRT